MKLLPLTLVILSGLTVLASCTAGPTPPAPVMAVPEAWTESSGTREAADFGAWWRAFNDPLLDQLIGESRAGNTDLRIAVERLREARAQRGVVAAALAPQVDVSGSFSNSHFSENGFLKGLGGSGGSGLPGAAVPGQEINLWQAGIDASWEVDLFGRNRSAVEAANAEIAASGFDVGDVLLALTAEVAEAYAQLRGVQSRLDLAQRTLTSEQQTLAVVREQAAAGVGSDLDVSRAETQVSQIASHIPELQSAERVAVRRLEVLTGGMPGTLDGRLLQAQPIPHAPEALNAGIPSDVLRRRPDIRAAEQRLTAAQARIGVATADLFPRFSLTGSFGLQSQEFGDLPSGDSRFWAIGPSVRWPVLDFGRVRSNIDVQSARAAQAAAIYEGTVIRALSDVEVALVRLARGRARAAQLEQASASAHRSVTLAEDLYRGGMLEFLELLDAQRTEYTAQDAAAQAQVDVMSDTVTLYRALGGGWQSAMH